MRCLRMITNERYSHPCGNCPACAARAAGAAEFIQRAEHQISGNLGLFITATYETEALPRTDTPARVVLYSDSHIKRLKVFSEIYDIESSIVDWLDLPETDCNYYTRKLAESYIHNKLMHEKRIRGRELTKPEIKRYSLEALRKAERQHKDYPPMAIADIPAGVPTLDREQITKFHKRLRITLQRHVPWLRYTHYTIGELGGKKGRPHFHANLFFETDEPTSITRVKNVMTPIIQAQWRYGEVQVKKLRRDHPGYAVKYLGKKRKGFMAPRRLDTVENCSVFGTPEILKSQTKANGRTGSHSLGDRFKSKMLAQLKRATESMHRVTAAGQLEKMMSVILKLNRGATLDDDAIRQACYGLDREDLKHVDLILTLINGSWPMQVPDAKGRLRDVKMPVPYRMRRDILRQFIGEEGRQKMVKLIAKVGGDLNETKTPDILEEERQRSIEQQENYMRLLQKSDDKASEAVA